jgi:hypothetical protein
MSQQNQQNGRLINILLITVLAYLGFMLIFNSQGPRDSRPAADIFKTLQGHAASLQDIQASRALPSYLSRVREEAKTNRLPEEEILRQEMVRYAGRRR